MARPRGAMLDWQVFSGAVRVGSAPAVWSRFPVELAPNLIVCPHLFDWDRSGRDRSEEEVYTCASVPLLMVFCGRGEHLRSLQTEVMPRVWRHARHAVLLDADHGRFAVDGESEILHP